MTKFGDSDDCPKSAQNWCFFGSGELQKMGRGCARWDCSMLMRLIECVVVDVFKSVKSLNRLKKCKTGRSKSGGSNRHGKMGIVDACSEVPLV